MIISVLQRTHRGVSLQFGGHRNGSIFQFNRLLQQPLVYCFTPTVGMLHGAFSRDYEPLTKDTPWCVPTFPDIPTALFNIGDTDRGNYPLTGVAVYVIEVGIASGSSPKTTVDLITVENRCGRNAARCSQLSCCRG